MPALKWIGFLVLLLSAAVVTVAAKGSASDSGRSRDEARVGHEISVPVEIHEVGEDPAMRRVRVAR